MKKIFVMGSLNMDISINTDIFPKEGETVIGNGFITNPGGKGANQAVAAARQGANVFMLGAVGNDLYGKELLENLKNNKINTKYVLKKDASTGVAVIIVQKGKNRIILSSGANYKYDFEDYKEVLKSNATAGDYFITQMETRLDNVIEGIKLAKSLNMKVVLNPAPAKQLPLDIYKYIDYIIPNEHEAEFLTGIALDSKENISKNIDIFLARGVKNVIITLGSAGCAYYDNGIKYYPIVDIPVIDTTGAGDVFISSFCVQLTRDKSIAEAIRHATICSALTVSRMGAQQSIPYYNEILEFEKGLE